MKMRCSGWKFMRETMKEKGKFLFMYVVITKRQSLFLFLLDSFKLQIFLSNPMWLNVLPFFTLDFCLLYSVD